MCIYNTINDMLHFFIWIIDINFTLGCEHILSNIIRYIPKKTHRIGQEYSQHNMI